LGETISEETCPLSTKDQVVFFKEDQSELLDEDLFLSNPAGKPPQISIGGHQPAVDFNRKSDVNKYMHSIQEVPEENDKSKSKNVESILKPSPPTPHVIRGPFQPSYPPYGTVLSNQVPLTTSNYTPEKPISTPQTTSTPQFNPIPQHPQVSSNFSSGQVATNQGQTTQGGPPKRQISDNSLLNQSLNSSIRIQKSLLKKMDQSLAEGKNLDESSVIELNIDDNGFLIDAQGFPVLNDKGEPMKLTDDNLDFLKENGLYEEAVIEDCGN
jgi:hypothetical protein